MRQLSALDASFLYLESPEMPMHVGALHVFELPKGWKGRFVDALRRHMANRLPIAPALRRKLAWMPLNLANPAWVDAEVDLDWHVRSVRLPAGAGMKALHEQVAKLHPELLDRDRPLWQFTVFEGLAPGPGRTRRVAMYTKLHHAAVDGQAAVALANAILDTTPEPRQIEAWPARPKKFELGLVEMITGSIVNELQQARALVRSLPQTVGSLGGAAKQLLSSDGPSLGGLALGPRTRFNKSITARRVFTSLSLPLADLKAAAKRHGGTLNDAVLMICGSALRRFFQRHGPLPRKPLVAAVPISLREAGDTASNNQASMTLVPLGTHVADARTRLAHVMAATAAMKRTLGKVKSVLPTDIPSIGVGLVLSAAAKLYADAKVAERLPAIANLVISNVPGPPFPLYLAGAKMLTNYPTSIVIHGVALNITVQSYDRSLDFGLIACARACPHIDELADDLRAAFEEFMALEPAAPVAQATAKPPAKATRGKRAHAGASTASTRKAASKATAKKAAAGRGTALRSASRGAVAKKTTPRKSSAPPKPGTATASRRGR